jgi:hypothetical protein
VFGITVQCIAGKTMVLYCIFLKLGIKTHGENILSLKVRGLKFFRLEFSDRVRSSTFNFKR